MVAKSELRAIQLEEKYNVKLIKINTDPKKRFLNRLMCEFGAESDAAKLLIMEINKKGITGEISIIEKEINIQ